MQAIITADELLDIYEDSDVVIIDASNSADAFENYLKQHLKKALFVDANKDLAKIGDPKFGGRHPLPPIVDFLQVLSNLGITKQSRVVVYDNHFGANAAARFWWMLRSIGHKKVQVLDGGFEKAVEAGFPVTDTTIQSETSRNYQDCRWNLPQVSINEVRQAIEESNHIIIDVRDSQRYNGITEPIDLVAGHIPSAVNVSYKLNLNDDGTFRKPEELRELYRKIIGSRNESEIIIHCGSGITACHTLLAFDIAGLRIPTLYVGSWSEWSNNY